MEQAVPHASERALARVKPFLSEFTKMFVAAFLSAVLAGAFTYVYSRKLQAEASVQQQYVASVQDFAATGGRVDAAITNLADAAVDQDSVAEAKKEARQAIASHAAATLALEPIIGKGNVEAYMLGIADMRTLVDATGDVPAATRASKGRFALIDNRNVIIAEARRNIYE